MMKFKSSQLCLNCERSGHVSSAVRAQFWNPVLEGLGSSPGPASNCRFLLICTFRVLTWETSSEFLALGFGLFQPWLLWTFGK